MTAHAQTKPGANVDGGSPAAAAPIDPIKDDEFAAAGALEDGRVTLRFWGNADLRVKDRLDVFLRQADRQALDAGVPEVVVDLQRLDFMNSCCLKALVTWLGKVQDRPAGEQYRVLFLKDPAAHWQARSLHALVAFAPGMIRIE
jgi:hypothetical protein